MLGYCSQSWIHTHMLNYDKKKIKTETKGEVDLVCVSSWEFVQIRDSQSASEHH